MPYFNYSIVAVSAAEATLWQRREFVRAWAPIYREDSRWTKPAYGPLYRELNPRRSDHLARLQAQLIRIDALHRTGLRSSRTDQQEIPLTSIFERTLVGAVGIIDPRRRGKSAHLALLHLHNDVEAFERLYYHLVDEFSADGYHRLVGPVGLSPHLDSGVLVDDWNAWPPRHTPGNPPYLPELLERKLEPLQVGRLFRVETPARPSLAAPGPAAIRPFDPMRLAADLGPLLVAATENPVAGFPPPDTAEAQFLLRWLGARTLTGLLAELEDQPVGFILLGADDAPRGATSWPGRFRRPRAGRVLFGAVAHEWRGRGIGRGLWEHALHAARGQGWETLTVGPIWLPATGDPPAATFLRGAGAAAAQTYHLYQRSF